MAQCSPRDVLQRCNLLFSCTPFPCISLLSWWFYTFSGVLLEPTQRGVSLCENEWAVVKAKVFLLFCFRFRFKSCKKNKQEYRTMPQSSRPVVQMISNYLSRVLYFLSSWQHFHKEARCYCIKFLLIHPALYHFASLACINKNISCRLPSAKIMK